MTTITINRATVEQALEAMRRAVPTGQITLYEWDKAMDDLNAALAEDALDRLAENERALGIQMEAPRATLAQQAKPQGCDHCNHPLYAATRCRVCGRVTEQAEPVEPVAKVIATAPKRIWLDLGFDPADEDITFDQLFEATWSQDNATGWGIEYVRADLVAPPQRKVRGENT